MFNVKLHKWITSSILKHFESKTNIKPFVSWQIGDTELPMIWAEEDANTPQQDHFELGITDGPHINEVSKGFYEIEVEITCLVSAYYRNNSYSALDTNVGIVAAAYDGIQVKKYGDDSTLVGCLNLMNTPNSKDERLRVIRYGEIDKNTKLYQASVIGKYDAQLEL